MLAIAKQKQERGFPKLAISERREYLRCPVAFVAPCLRMDHSIAALRQRQIQIRLIDVSEGGLAAFSEVPLNIGESLAVQIPPIGPNPAWGNYGSVIRCDAVDQGFRIAVAFDLLPAA